MVWFDETNDWLTEVNVTEMSLNEWKWINERSHEWKATNGTKGLWNERDWNENSTEWWKGASIPALISINCGMNALNVTSEHEWNRLNGGNECEMSGMKQERLNREL